MSIQGLVCEWSSSVPAFSQVISGISATMPKICEPRFGQKRR
ncbi:MAG TPA: hypothetical protein VHX88_11185 [Solirubrobacteraceae bacterium]|jgi:hypothetical protein|nr:hypothetical protein [Solirubrobacteraceae bacterium]